MNTLFTKSALSAAIALTLVACGGSSGGLAGIGGSGFISSGSITGFGSVIVNGVKFETDSATFDVDGMSGKQDDLAIGMIVNVSGSIDADGLTGTATSISFDDELQGPVSDLLPLDPDADNLTRTFTVLGITVIIDSGSTTFDIDDDITTGTVFGFDAIKNNNNVEISGFFDSNNVLVATRVELEDIDFAPDDIVEIKGTISDLVNTTFKLTNLEVDASIATLEDIPGNILANGQFVEVKGTFDPATNTILAREIEAEDDALDDADEFELEGLITEFNGNADFKVKGILVDASNAIFEPASLSSTLKNDLRVEVEGEIVGGKLIATEVELEGGNIKVHAQVTAVPPVTAINTFEVTPVLNQPAITVTVTSGTQFEDEVSASPSPTFNISDLVAGTFVEVEGHENDSSNGFTATEVEVKESDDVIVQGNLQAIIKDDFITVLGVSFQIDDIPVNNGETDFEDTADEDITQDIFITDAPEGTLVKIKDKSVSGVVNGIADEIEIELP